jgi:hypothetical protein
MNYKSKSIRHENNLSKSQKAKPIKTNDLSPQEIISNAAKFYAKYKSKIYNNLSYTQRA